MEPETTYYEENDFLNFKSGNKASRKASLAALQNIKLGGKCLIKSGCIFRADLHTIGIGRYFICMENTVLRPAMKKTQGTIAYCPLTVGDFVFIDTNCVVEAAGIGSCIYVGKNCIIGKRCILKDCCRIEDNTILAPDTIVPPFAIMGGNPGRMIGQLPESAASIARDRTMDYYRSFVPRPLKRDPLPLPRKV